MRFISSFEERPFRGTAPSFVTAVVLGLVSTLFTAAGVAQVNVLTQHNDNARTGANVNETILTPANVNATQFGPLFSLPVDGMVAAQPLYVSNVNIPGRGVHNVLYAVTLHDSVYAFDADDNTGANANPLWSVNFLNPAAGVTAEAATELGCTTTTKFTEMGILPTPVIDLPSGTIYVLAKTKENGSYHFRLHALDITTGIEKSGGPIDVMGSVTGKVGTLSLTASGNAMIARPGLLLSQGIVYLSFGSNGCDGQNTRGWVVAYDSTSLLQLGIFNDTMDNKGARGNIWQAGSGPATDDQGNIFFAAANGAFDANLGNRDYGSSIIKIGWGTGGLTAKDYFTPYNYAYLNSKDLDVGSSGVVLFPDQAGAHSHMMIGSGKEGSIYVLDRDNMGQFNPIDNSQIATFIPFDSNGGTGGGGGGGHTPPGAAGVGAMFSTPAYWNNFVYFTGQKQGLTQFSLTNSVFQIFDRNATVMGTPHTPSISANGTSNGIVWIPQSANLQAYDALDMTKNMLYGSPGMGTLAHFNTPTVVNGKVYVGANLSVQVLGLLGNLQPTSGNNQSVSVFGTVAAPLQVTATNHYSGLPVSGITITFSDGGKSGTFNPPSAVTDSSGHASALYTASKTAGTFPITASGPSVISTTFSVTVLPGAANRIKVVSGSNQTAPIQTTYAAPLVVQPLDANLNGVPGMSITFSDGGKGGIFSANPVISDSTGKAQTFYTTGTKTVSKVTFTATSGTLKISMYGVVTAGPATTASVVSGNNQTGAISTTLVNPLVVLVVDPFNNPVPSATVTFTDNGAGGTLSSTSLATDATGKASVTYTLPSTGKVVTINASINGSTSTNFTETAQ